MSTVGQNVQYIKVVVVGESGVGKSNILSRYLLDKFLVGNNATIGLEFAEKQLQLEGRNILLQVWDTAGQERFRALNTTFYKNSLGALVVFSLTDRQSFLNLGKWVQELLDSVEENAVLLLIGNKSDLNDRKVSVAEAMEFARENQMGYLETSAALNVNINQAFQLLLGKIMHQIMEEQIPQSKIGALKINEMRQSRVQKGKKKKCCA